MCSAIILPHIKQSVMALVFTVAADCFASVAIVFSSCFAFKWRPRRYYLCRGSLFSLARFGGTSARNCLRILLFLLRSKQKKKEFFIFLKLPPPGEIAKKDNICEKGNSIGFVPMLPTNNWSDLHRFRLSKRRSFRI